VGKLTITGIDANGNQRSETVEIQEPGRFFHTSHRYKQISAPEPGLHFVVIRRPGLWRRLMRFFGFGKWKTIVRGSNDV